MQSAWGESWITTVIFSGAPDPCLHPNSITSWRTKVNRFLFQVVWISVWRVLLWCPPNFKKLQYSVLITEEITKTERHYFQYFPWHGPTYKWNPWMQELQSKTTIKEHPFWKFPTSAFITHLGNQHLLLVFNLLLLPGRHILELGEGELYTCASNLQGTKRAQAAAEVYPQSCRTALLWCQNTCSSGS